MTTDKEPQANHDLVKLAAIRWYANRLENLAIQKYLGKVARWPEINIILENALRYMDSLPVDRVNPEPDCPWPVCPDGVCAPTCVFDQLK